MLLEKQNSEIHKRQKRLCTSIQKTEVFIWLKIKNSTSPHIKDYQREKNHQQQWLRSTGILLHNKLLPNNPEKSRLQIRFILHRCSASESTLINLEAQLHNGIQTLNDPYLPPKYQEHQPSQKDEHGDRRSHVHSIKIDKNKRLSKQNIQNIWFAKKEIQKAYTYQQISIQQGKQTGLKLF